MKSRLLILAGVFVAVWLACLLVVTHDAPVTARASVVVAAPPEPAPEAETEAQKAAYQEQTRQGIADLARLETAQRRRSELEAKRGQSLRELGLLRTRASAWSAIVATNWPAYQALREQAAAAPSKMVHCTICEGRGLMSYCVVCEHSGKCIACKGTGLTPFGQVCPTCRGSGKCYLCFGTGKMPCLFCDDGDVYAKGPFPPQNMPMPAAPAVAQAPQKVIRVEPKPVDFEASDPVQPPHH